MKVLGILKNGGWLFLLFVLDQIVAIPQIVAMSTHPNVIGLILLIVIYVVTTGAVIILLIQVYRYKIKMNHSRFGITKLNRKLLVFMLMITALWILFLFVQTWYVKQFGIGNSENQAAIEKMFKNLPTWTMIDGIIIAPIMEELIFRGIFFELFFKKNQPVIKITGIIVNAALFGGLHDLGMSFPIYAVMGGLLAWTYMHTRDVRYSITIHILNNLISFI